MAQQKQHNQLILTVDKNIFTYCFQQYNAYNRWQEYFYLLFPTIQRLQPNFKTDSIRNFMYTKHNRDKAKLRVFLPQRQRIQPNFMNHTYHTTKHTNKTRSTKATTSMWVSPLTQSLCSYNWDNANSGVFIFKLRNKSTSFVHYHQLLQFIDPEKSVRDLMNNFVHYIHYPKRWLLSCMI